VAFGSFRGAPPSPPTGGRVERREGFQRFLLRARGEEMGVLYLLLYDVASTASKKKNNNKKKKEENKKIIDAAGGNALQRKDVFEYCSQH
jgi:hypothetical protein